MISRLQFQGERYRRKKFTLANSIASFDGVNDFINLQYPINLSPLSDFSISLLFSIDGFQNNNVNHILSQYDLSGGSTIGFYIDLVNTGNLLRVGYANNGQFDFIETAIQDHKIYFIYASYLSGVLSLYLNGEFVGSISTNQKFGMANVPILLGATQNNGSIQNFFKGKIGAVKLFQSPSNDDYLHQSLFNNPFILPAQYASYCVGEWDLNGNRSLFGENINQIHRDATICEFDWTTADGSLAKDQSLNDFNLAVRGGYDAPHFSIVSGLSCIGPLGVSINPGLMVDLQSNNYLLQETFTTVSVIRANTNTSGNNSGIFYSFDNYLANGSKGFNMGYSANVFSIDGIDTLNSTGRYSVAEWKDLNDRKFIVVINVHGIGTLEFPNKTYINGVLAAQYDENATGEFKKINEINLMHRDDAIANANRSHQMYYFSCIKGDITKNPENWQSTIEFLKSKFIEGIEWGITNPNILTTITSQSRFKIAESLFKDSSNQYSYAKTDHLCSPGFSRQGNCGYFRDLQLTTPVLQRATNMAASGFDAHRRMVKDYSNLPYSLVEFSMSGGSGGIFHWPNTEFRLLDKDNNLIESIPAIIPPLNGNAVQRIYLKNAAKLEILNNSTFNTGEAGITQIKESIFSGNNHGLIMGRNEEELGIPVLSSEQISVDFYNILNKRQSAFAFLKKEDFANRLFIAGFSGLSTNNPWTIFLKIRIPEEYFDLTPKVLMGILSPASYNTNTPAGRGGAISPIEIGNVGGTNRIGSVLWNLAGTESITAFGGSISKKSNLGEIKTIVVSYDGSKNATGLRYYVQDGTFDMIQSNANAQIQGTIENYTVNSDYDSRGFFQGGGRSTYGYLMELSIVDFVKLAPEVIKDIHQGFQSKGTGEYNLRLSFNNYSRSQDTVNGSHRLFDHSPNNFTAAIANAAVTRQVEGGDTFVETKSYLPHIINGLRLNGTSNFLKINDFNPTAEKGYNHIIILKNDFINMPFESVHRLYQVNDLLGDKVDHGTLTNFSGKSTIRMRSSGNYSSGFDDYLFEEYTPESTTIYSFYNEVLQGDVRRTIKVNNSVLVTGKNIVESEAGEGDYSRFGESVLNLGAGFSRGSAVAQWQGHILFYGMLKGELSHQHYLEIWNNGSPRMPKKEWGYDWQVVANLNRPVDPNGTPKIENLAGFLNPGVQNFEILMEGYSNEQLDSSNPQYAFVNIDSLK